MRLCSWTIANPFGPGHWWAISHDVMRSLTVTVGTSSAQLGAVRGLDLSVSQADSPLEWALTTNSDHNDPGAMPMVPINRGMSAHVRVICDRQDVLCKRGVRGSSPLSSTSG
jgi:hypothetical protein